MKANKNAFTGTGKVFSFTLTQLLKSKGNIISLVVTIILCLLSAPIASLIMGGEVKEEQLGINNIYYLNETEYDIEFQALSEPGSLFEGAKVQEADFNVDNYTDNINGNDALVHVALSSEDNSYHIGVYHLMEDAYSFDILASEVSRLCEEARFRALGATEEQLKILMTAFEINTEEVAEYMEEESVGFDGAFAVQYGYSIIVLILTMFSITYIIRSIIEEKASKLVETLMVSIKPLGMIVGKILAVMAYVFGLIVSIALSLLISYKVTGVFLDTSPISNALADFGLNSELLNIGPITIIVAMISLVLGYLTFSILGGLAGTSCSSMEEVESANMNVVLVVMLGYMASTFMVGFNNEVVSIIGSLLPIISIFAAPVHYVLGNISFGILALSWLLQAGVIILLAWFCGRVYHHLLMYRGNKLKLKAMVSLARTKQVKEV
ncbi:ABC transporter permease [Alloiococcus sp. CFN-8]|uniref:ABC transporter permease n=1 Tax=Alloiococcus sp. CFN-8 TaxID=3416081 RepID=UPI003CE9CF17